MSPSEFPSSSPSPVQGISWPSEARAHAFSQWLGSLEAPHQLRPPTLRPASADASFRRYFRIDSTTDSFIVMDAPPDREDCAPFVRVAALMAAAGLRVPQILAWDPSQGFMLLSDLGARTMMQSIVKDDAASNLPLYLKAVDALIKWQSASRSGELPPYDAMLLRRELELFPDWYLARHRALPVEGELRQTLDTMFALITERNLSWPSVYVHRDFMPRNLMMPPDPSSDPLGVLDFQDAVFGPITYDIASLMRDAFLSWDEDFVLEVTIRYWEKARKFGLPVGDDFGEFYRGVEWMGLQRHLKVAGIFARLTLRDGKPQYLADAPRFIGYIRATCARYAELKPLLKLVDRVENITESAGYAFGRI